MNARPPLSRERLDAVLLAPPASRALEVLMECIPHVPMPGRRFNRTQELLNHVYAVDGSFGTFGMALFIDYGTGQEFDQILDAMKEVGASITAEYLEEGRRILGGFVPSDECERANLTEIYDKELREVDSKFLTQIQGEAAAALIGWLRANTERALADLNQTEE